MTIFIPRGMRVRNPFNIRKSDAHWLGKVPSSDPAFEQFDTVPHGIRAGLKILLSYYTIHGLKTVHDIINRWAPPTDDNPTSAYVDFVAKYCGVAPDDPVNVQKPGFLLRLAHAIIEDEQGSDTFVSDAEIKTEIDKIITPSGDASHTSV